jgi:hypothetical protein
MTNILIADGIYEQLQEHSEAMGVPVAHAVTQALDYWLQCVAPVRVAAIAQTQGKVSADVQQLWDVPEPAFAGGAALVSAGHPHVSEDDFIALADERNKDTKVKG